MKSTANTEQHQLLLPSQEKLKSELCKQKLFGFAECYEEQCINPNLYQNLSFEERLNACLIRQEEYEKKKKCERLIKNANFKETLTINEIAKSPSKGLTDELLKIFSGTSWIEKGKNIAITGGCGVGKTTLACAIGRTLASHGISVLYYSTSDILIYIESAKDHLTRTRTYKKFAQIKVLIWDDFGLHGKYSDDERKILLEIADRRYGINSTIICSPFRKAEFCNLFPQNSGAEMLLDRLLHPCLEIALEGESRRGPKLQVEL